MRVILRAGSLIACLFLFSAASCGQVFDNQCPATQSSMVPLRTVNITNGHFNDTVCADIFGNLNFLALNPSLSASDTFTRANGALGSNWNTGILAPTIQSNAAGGVSGQYSIAQWKDSALVSSTQFAQATIAVLGAGESGPAVFVSNITPPPATNGAGYFCGEGTTSITLYRTAGSVTTSLGTSAITGANGDILRLEITAVGGLTCYRNGVSTLTASDTTYKSGSPGLIFRGAAGTPSTYTNWSGGNLPVSAGAGPSHNGITTFSNIDKTVYWDGIVYPQTSTGLQVAINAACNGLTPGRVVLPLFGTVTASGITIPSLCNISGMGQGETIIQLPSSSAAGATVFKNLDQVNGNTGIYLHDFTIDGNKAGQTNVGQFGINFNKVSNSTLFHIECKNSMGNSASCVQWHTPGSNSSNHDNTIEFCYFHDNGSSAVNNADGLGIGGVRIRVVGVISNNNTDSGVGLQGASSTDIVILNGIYQGNTLTGVAFGATGSPQGDNQRITIENNVFISNGVSIASFRSNDVVITGNMMKTTVGSGNIEHMLIVSTQGATISGNRIVGAVTNGITINDTLSTDLSQDINISSNTIRANGQAGIRLLQTNSGAKVKNIIISNNIITNNSQTTPNSIDGINISTSSPASITNLIIGHNILSDDQGSPTQRYGIASTSGANAPSGLVMDGNQGIGNATGAYINLPIDAASIVSTFSTPHISYRYNTETNCAQNTVSPAACGSAASGVIAVPTTTTTYTVNSTAVTANSRIFLQDITDNTGIPSAPTCTALATFGDGQVSARVAGTSFTFSLPSTAGTTCFSYWIVN